MESRLLGIYKLIKNRIIFYISTKKTSVDMVNTYKHVLKLLVAGGKNKIVKASSDFNNDLCCLGWLIISNTYPANTKHLYNICTTSDQRLRRCYIIVQMLYKCFVFTGKMITSIVYVCT